MTKRVLLIDDDRDSIKYLATVLRTHGYETAHAYDGSEGLQKAQELQPDLIVLDVVMPEKSGLLVCSELKRNPHYRHIPILMLTGVRGVLENLESREEATAGDTGDPLLKALKKKIHELRDEGLVTPDMFVDKPVEPDAFVAKVQQLIGD